MTCCAKPACHPVNIVQLPYFYCTRTFIRTGKNYFTCGRTNQHVSIKSIDYAKSHRFVHLAIHYFFFLFTCLPNCFLYTSPFYHALAYHHWMRGTIHRDQFSKKFYQNSILEYGKIYFFLSEARLVKFGLLGQIQPHGHAQGLDFKWPCLYFLKQQLTAVQNVKLEIFIVDYTVSFFSNCL